MLRRSRENWSFEEEAFGEEGKGAVEKWEEVLR